MHRKLLGLLVPSARNIVVRMIRELDSLASTRQHLLGLSTEGRGLLSAGIIVTPLPHRKHRLALTESLRDDENAHLLASVLGPRDLASPDSCGSSSLLSLRLPDTLELHLALEASGVHHDNVKFAVDVAGGDFPAVVGSLRDEGIVAGGGLGDLLNGRLLEEVGLLGALGVFGPLGEEVGGVANTDWTIGQDDNEGLVIAVGLPIESAFVDKHCD